jgi:1-aminocyclopropane-1-carboxylate deaminase
LVQLSYQTTPIVQIHDRVAEEAGIQLLVKREDINHLYVSGNKWWKLKYNLSLAIQRKQNTLLTFGGAYSNHLYATAAAARELGLRSIGIVRGEEVLPLNPTLSFARDCGMQLHYISRERYRAKNTVEFGQWIAEQFGDVYVIPEGGTNDQAIAGCRELSSMIQAEVSFDFIALPVGTGGTMAGIISGLQQHHTAIGYSVLKGGEFLEKEVDHWLNQAGCKHRSWRIATAYHHGGYGKRTPGLMQFISKQEELHGLPLDPVYTGKLCYGLWDEIQRGVFPRGSTVLMLHTGGMQGALSK